MISLGQILFTISALSVSLGAFLADFNETHVLNPRWPPHARFHNGQTMSMGASLGLATLYYAFRKVSSVEQAVDSARMATLVGSLYWATGLSAIFYPGSKGTDPEFGEGFPQGWGFGALLFGTVLGGWLEVRRVRGADALKSKGG